MHIDEATKQVTATLPESDERNSSTAGMGAEIGTAADGQTKATGIGAGYTAAFPACL